MTVVLVCDKGYQISFKTGYMISFKTGFTDVEEIMAVINVE